MKGNFIMEGLTGLGRCTIKMGQCSSENSSKEKLKGTATTLKQMGHSTMANCTRIKPMT
jgi:hypothetical protein